MRLFCALLLFMSITMTIPETSATDIPSPTSMELQSLKKQVEDLKKQRDDLPIKVWDDLYMWFGIAAVVCAALTWGFQKKGALLSDDARAFTDEIETREQRIQELYALEIEESKRRAGDAMKVGGDAMQRAENLAGDNIRLSGELKQQAATESAHAEQLRKQNLKTEADLQEANAALGQEQAKRIEMELSLQPRRLVYIEYEDGTSNIDALRALAPSVEVILQFLQDAEAERTAATLSALFDRAGWKVVSTVRVDSVAIPDGVTVRSYVPPSRFDPRHRRDGGALEFP